MNSKELFKRVINNDKLTNPDIISFANYCIERIPDYFWTIPASSSGKYHPSTDLGEGGLVRHSLMTYKVATDLLSATTNEFLLKLKDELLFACLFHDCCKNGLENSEHTQHEHPIIAAKFIAKCHKDFKEIYSCSSVRISVITETIKSHMGKWCTSKYSDTVLPTPTFEEEEFVHECDYIASRKYCLFDEEYFNKF